MQTFQNWVPDKSFAIGFNLRIASSLALWGKEEGGNKIGQNSRSYYHDA